MTHHQRFLVKIHRSYNQLGVEGTVVEDTDTVVGRVDAVHHTVVAEIVVGGVDAVDHTVVAELVVGGVVEPVVGGVVEPVVGGVVEPVVEAVELGEGVGVATIIVLRKSTVAARVFGLAGIRTPVFATTF